MGCGMIGSMHSSASRWLLLALAGAVALSCSRDDGVGPIAMRRLTADQYKQTIADVFGPDIKVVGRFEPDARREGLLAVGTAFVTITPAGFEQYETIARRISAQVIAPDNRDRFVRCTPEDASATDRACAEQFIAEVGRRLLRRELSDEDVAPRLEIAEATTRKLEDFYTGLEYALTSLLISPEFLFRVERASPDPDRTDRLRLTNDTIASRLSFFFWNSTPDDELLDAAERGDLAGGSTLDRQIERLVASRKLESGVRAFFSDLLRLDEIDEVSKDVLLYPRFNRQILADSREQTLRVITDHLVVRNADYRDLFTSRRSFMTRNLGLVYQVPVRVREGWEPAEFPEGSPRAGLLSHVSLLTLHSHPGRSSATLRGIFVREALMCQEVPAAPADVDFTVVQDTNNPEHKTARDRLSAHSTGTGCESCHRLMDPIGLGFENFDGIGMWRASENGESIDASGRVDGEAFEDLVGVGRVLRDNPGVSACAVESLFRYAVGRSAVVGEREFLRDLTARFAASGHRHRELMRMIAASEPFRTASALREIPPGSES